MKETSGSGQRRGVGKQKIGERDRLEGREEEEEEGYWREKREGNRGDLLKRGKGEEKEGVIFKAIVQRKEEKIGTNEEFPVRNWLRK